MAARQIRALINNAEFPFLYSQFGRSVVESTDLNQRMGTTFYGSSENAEWGVPQVIFCENALPYAKGMYTVGFGAQAAAISPAPANFLDQAIILRDPAENLRLMSPANGLNLVYDAATSLWTSYNPVVGFTGELITRAYVNGRTFIFYEATKLLEWDEGTTSFTDHTASLILPAGTTLADIRGIAGVSNYLVFWTELTVHWCSPANIFDFNETDIGAGNQIPQDIKGRITALLPVSGGAIVYSARNAVGMTFTNNAAAPFIFKEITNGGGVTSYERITAEANDTGHYAWTSNGLQKLTINPHTAENFAPACTDFLVGNIFEKWNPTTKEVDIVEIGSAFSVKLFFAASRYLVISYGQERNLFDAALIYDVGLRRWGKVNIAHCDCFMYPYPSVAGDYFYSELPGFYTDLGENTYADLDVVRTQVIPPKRGIAFLGQLGEINLLNTDFTQADVEDAVIIVGHFQQVRGQLVTFQRLEVEGLFSDSLPTVSLLLSDSGHMRELVEELVPVTQSSKYCRYDTRVTAENGDIAIEGAIVLSTLMLEVTKHGSR